MGQRRSMTLQVVPDTSAWQSCHSFGATAAAGRKQLLRLHRTYHPLRIPSIKYMCEYVNRGARLGESESGAARQANSWDGACTDVCKPNDHRRVPRCNSRPASLPVVFKLLLLEVLVLEDLPHPSLGTNGAVPAKCERQQRRSHDCGRRHVPELWWKRWCYDSYVMQQMDHRSGYACKHQGTRVLAQVRRKQLPPAQAIAPTNENNTHQDAPKNMLTRTDTALRWQ